MEKDLKKIENQKSKLKESGEDKNIILSSEHLQAFYSNKLKLSGPATKEFYTHSIDDSQFVQVDLIKSASAPSQDIFLFQRAGPRKEIVFVADETKVCKVAIVSCGTLCPGINDCIEELVKTLYYNYGVNEIYGIKFGMKGFFDNSLHSLLKLTPKNVEGLHDDGGVFIGTSRGGKVLEEERALVVDFLNDNDFRQLYMIGGDGTMRAAENIAGEINSRKLAISVVGIPATVENDIGLIDASFGFHSGIEEAASAILRAVIEAKSVSGGIGIVKMIGSKAGFLAANAALAARSVDLVLIPEVKFELEGDKGILPYLASVTQTQGYVVILVAEGSGNQFVTESQTLYDNEGKSLFPVAQFLSDQITKYFLSRDLPCSIKIYDPNFWVRTRFACTSDTISSMLTSQNAVHGAMAGFTNFAPGEINSRSCMIPLNVLNACSPVTVNPGGRLWERVLTTTQQPRNNIS